MPDDTIKVTFQISGSFLKMVRRTSVVHVRKKFAVAGDAYIEVTVGDRKAGAVKNGDSLKFEPEPDIMKTVTDALEDVRKSLLPLLDNTKEILIHVNGIVKSVDEGKGAAGRLINDPEVGNSIKQTVADVQRTTAQLPGIVSNAAAVSVDIQGLTRGLSNKVEHVDELVVQTTDAIKETERLIQGLQRHWLIRRYVPQPPEATELISPMDLMCPEGALP
jgi:phospholipid/cholesterol/gamma-HCH transport system substrate-binding protein